MLPETFLIILRPWSIVPAGKVVYAPPEFLLIVLCGMLVRAEDFVGMEPWLGAKSRFALMLPFVHSVPVDDTPNDVMNTLPPAAGLGQKAVGECQRALHHSTAPDRAGRDMRRVRRKDHHRRARPPGYRDPVQRSMGVLFRDDLMHRHTEYGPANTATTKQAALTFIRAHAKQALPSDAKSLPSKGRNTDPSSNRPVDADHALSGAR